MSEKYYLKPTDPCAIYPRRPVGASISQRAQRNCFVHTPKLHNSFDTSIASNSHHPRLMGECTHSKLRRSTPGITSNTVRLILPVPRPRISYSQSPVQRNGTMSSTVRPEHAQVRCPGLCSPYTIPPPLPTNQKAGSSSLSGRVILQGEMRISVGCKRACLPADRDRFTRLQMDDSTKD
jgi:hypothetical protein